MLALPLDIIKAGVSAGQRLKGELDRVNDERSAFFAALEKVDRACLENDLDALQISVEVLNEQLDRKRR